MSRRLAVPAAWVAALVVLAAVVYAGTDPPRLRHDSALDTVFDARWLIAGARVLAIVAVLYLLASVAVRVQHGQWVRSAGSVSTGPSSVVADVPTAEAIEANRQDLQRQLAAAKTTIDDLTARLDRSLATREAAAAGSMAVSPEVRSPAPEATPGARSEGSDDRS